MNLKFIFALFLTITCNEGAKILGIFHFASYSHYQIGDRILKELAERGHEVTVITPYAEKVPVKNFKTVVLTGAVEEMAKHTDDILKYASIPPLIAAFFMIPMVTRTIENTLAHPNVQKLLESDEKFDVIIIEQVFNEAFQGFCYRFDSPCITLSSVASNVWLNPQVGNPRSPSYVPEMVTGYKSDMNFFQRVCNTFVYILEVLFYELYNMPMQNKLLQKYFPGAPHISELYYNTSLVMVNTNPGLSNPVPLVPNMIEIGGYHVKSPKTLPNDLQEYLDSAKGGAIYFSMGSNIKSANIDPEKREGILRAFAKFKNIKVLWKWEDDKLSNKPDNVKISKWLPQQDILAHPNVKLFISHGGFLSTIETVYHGVPIIGVPVFADQKANIANAVNEGFAIKVNYNDLNEDSLTLAISEILSDPRYTENVKRKSRILNDQPMKPLDTAVFWVEYVIRHKGAPHLRTAALELNWYQYFLLDVIAFASVGFWATMYIFYVLFKKICGYKIYVTKILHKRKSKINK